MAYCTYTDLQNMTGTKLTQSVLTAIIAAADRRIDGILAKSNLTGSGDTIKQASIELSIAGVLTRHSMDGTQPDSITVGTLAMGLNTQSAIAYHEKLGLQLVQDFIDENSKDVGEAYVYITNG